MDIAQYKENYGTFESNCVLAIIKLTYSTA